MRHEGIVTRCSDTAALRLIWQWMEQTSIPELLGYHATTNGLERTGSDAGQGGKKFSQKRKRFMAQQTKDAKAVVQISKDPF